jgi:5-methylcytosine-specific restriction protein A
VPTLAFSACRVRTCPNLADANGFCRSHARAPWAGSAPMPTGWARIRAAILRRDPACRRCGAPSVTVNHIVARANGGTEHPSNLEGLCKACHDDITKAQAAAGRAARRP